MKIAVIAANGKTGSLITQEAVDKGMSVTAVVRNENKTLAQAVLKKDIFELTASDLAGFDAVVDAVGFWSPEDLVKHETSLKHLADILFDTTPYKTKIAGEITNFAPQDILGPKGLRTFDRSTKLVMAASKLCLDDANLTINEESRSEERRV